MSLFNIKEIFSSLTTFLTVITGFIGITIVIYGFEQSSLLIKIAGNLITITSCSYLFISASKKINSDNGFEKATGAMKIILATLIIIFLLLSNFFL